ncbi:hypothetical protein ACWOCB_06170 [Gemella haemolysans]|uniref:Uncharacterized protein n=1 Tax=Gemella haemolysans ATCC 10379 TaxID=546270 RepID=C5NWQ5_9BACL|nr:hypothetical protein [Gemella haemolysans]EER68286.1 hypothetical protein GEMHA0001_1571 [Gemella haemolysans ATCC 10379]KAA8707538.1 hypothetical protein F4V11_05830 [Gemella haemolysans]UBH81785.1 hypothetical protein LA340_05500 [Gemella haemolysans]VEI38306.1 salicylate biosynthesis isochorismate synthase [Gemella haemolysans]
MNDYQKIIDYDFSDTVLDDKLVVKFKLKKTFTEAQFISLFTPKKGERFIIRTPDTKSSIIGIGYEATWLLDSNDFLTSFDNSSVLSGFEELRAQVSVLEIDEHDCEYFGIYGGISDGNNKNSQEWVDFSDTSFVVPGILAVFKDDDVYITLFFNMKEEKEFSELWAERISFLNKLDDENEISSEPQINVVREIYPELWQENIRKALLQIEKEELKRIVLSRKNLILLENNTSLGAVTKYLLSKNRYFIAFESKKSLFITTNPLISLDYTDNDLKAHLYLKKENLFNNDYSVMFDEEEIINEYKEDFESHYNTDFKVYDDKTLMGKKLDVFSVLNSKVEDSQQAIKALSLLYPMPIIKGYPENVAKKFFDENYNVGYGFWYSPFGYITNNLDAKFYTCGNMMVAQNNMITLFTSILLSKGEKYDEVIEKSNKIVSSSLKLFDH